MTQYRYRRVDEGADGGEFVTEAYSLANPDTTVREEVPDDLLIEYVPGPDEDEVTDTEGD